MDKITEKDFLYGQCSCLGQPDPKTEGYFIDMANRILLRITKTGAGTWLPHDMIKPLALCLTGYYQDVIADGGPWHAFIDRCRALYGRWVPFYEIPDDYLEYELNYIDVRFIIWYFIAMSCDDLRDIDPLDSRIEKLAVSIFELMDSRYNEAPIPESWTVTHELEMRDPDDHQQIYAYGSWLFLQCYLMTPAFALSLHHILSDLSIDSNDIDAISKQIDEAIKDDTIGPLALYMREWLYLIIEGKLPMDSDKSENKEEHRYYKLVTEATGGPTTMFFKTYDELNRFFIETLGWEAEERHLPQLADSQDFVVMVNRQKGMLVAKDVARCIAAPHNGLYDKEYAKRHAFELLTVRGKCPADLLTEIKENGWLPDASFPGTDNRALVTDNFDFIARCYLQKYYRGV